jgi:hypothetical protein
MEQVNLQFYFYSKMRRKIERERENISRDTIGKNFTKVNNEKLKSFSK